ncbi:MAG: hypothetical protein ABL882_05025 [Sphingopyxis sp.]
MSEFSIGAAWSEAMAFLQRNMTLLLVLVGGSVLLAAIIQTFVFGLSQAAFQAQMQSAMTSGNMEAFLTTVLPGVAGAGLLGAIIQSTGQFAALRMGLSGEEDYASALSYGVVAAIVSTLFWVALAFALAVIFGIILAALGAGAVFAGGGGGGAVGAGMIGMFALVALLLIPLALWLAVRLWVIAPAMADARSANPLFGLSQSWRLSAPHQWTMLGYLILLIIAAIVIFGILGAIVGFIGAMLGETVGPILVAIVTGVPAGILGLAINAGVYRTLAPRDHGEIFA